MSGVFRRSRVPALKVLILALVAIGALSGCATMKQPTAKRFVLERSWARHTLMREYLGARINHVMEPLLFEGLVIQGNEVDGIMAYDQVTGRQRWKRAIQGGVTASAKIEGDTLLFGAGDGFFYALDALTGRTKWSFPIRSEGIGSPLVQDGVVYFLTGTNTAYALKVASGEQIWVYSRPDSANLTVRGASEPTSWGTRLYAGFSDGVLVALDRAKGTVIWEKPLSESGRFRDVDSKPVIDGNTLYVSSYDGQLYALDVSTGQTLWVNDQGGFSPVTVSGANLYYSSSTRKVLALDKASGKVLWDRDLKTTVATPPVVYRGLVFFGEWSGVFRALDLTTGSEVAHFATGRGVTSKAALDKKTDTFYVMTADANLFALKLKLKDRLSEE